MDGFLVPPPDGTVLLQEFVLNLHGGEGHVPLQRFIQQQTHLPPVLRHKGQGGVQALAGVVQGNLLPVKDHGAAGLVETHDAVGDSQLPLAGQAADAQNLTLAHIQGDIAHRLTGHVHPQILDGHNGLGIGLFVLDLGAGGGTLHVAAHHPACDIVHTGLFGGDVPDHMAVPHDHHLVTHRENLVKAVGDEDYGDLLGGHGPDGIQQSLGLLLRENGGGLVQNQQLELILAQLTGNLCKLLVAHGHTADDHFRVDLHAHLLDGRGGPPVHLLVVQGVEPLAEDLGDHILFLGLPIEEDILCGGEAGNQGELLVDHADAGLQRVEGGVEHRLLPVDDDVALIAAGLPDNVHTEEDFHQCGLTRAVLTAET